MKILLSLLLAATVLWADDEPITPPKSSVVLSWMETIDLISARMRYDVPGTVKEGPEDGYYTAPTQEAIDDLMAFFKARREMIPWIEDTFDCDDKATEFKYLASVWSVRRWHGNAPGVLVGKAYVRLDGDYWPLFPTHDWLTGYHVLNFVVRNDGEIFFIEPQTGCVAEVSSFIYDGSIEIVRLEY